MCGVTRRNNMHVTLQANNRVVTCGSTACKAAIPGALQEHRMSVESYHNVNLDLNSQVLQRTMSPTQSWNGPL
jgi:hypothetical protein